MSGLFSPNLKVLSDWRSSLRAAFGELRKRVFVVEDTFQMQPFAPVVDFRGMAVTAGTYVVNQARYLKIGKFMWITADFQATLGAPFTNLINVAVPGGYLAKGNLQTGDTGYQQQAILVQNAAVTEVGHLIIRNTSAGFELLRGNFAAHTAGAARWIFSFWMEVN